VLKLGDVVIERPVTELTLQTKGAFTDQYAAGNVGAGVLKRFNLVFDYNGQVIYFERNANDALPDVFDRSGLWINGGESNDYFEVLDVIAGGPADRAGIKVGDRIRAVDDATVDKLTLYGLRRQFKTSAPGTRIKLQLERAGKPTQAELVLREMV
jgi:predicted metalloprotease with PDZ domain